MIWYYTYKISKNTTTKLLELIKEFSKVAGYYINTQKSIVFLCTNNERPEKKNKKTFSFILFIPKVIITYLGVNLPKETKGIFAEMCWKRTQKYGEIYHVRWLEESILPKWLYYPNQSTESVQSLSIYQCYFK